MRFVLVEIKNDRALLKTRRTKKIFWTALEDLIFINSKHNRSKALKIKLDNNT